MAACVEIEEELSAYLDGEVSAELRVSIDEHLRGCTACQAIVADLKSIRSVLTDMPKLKAPATLAAAIHKEIAAEPVAAAAPAKASAKVDRSIDWKAAGAPPRHSAWAPVGFALAAMVMLCLLTFVVVPAIVKNRPGEVAMKDAPAANKLARNNQPEKSVAGAWDNSKGDKVKNEAAEVELLEQKVEDRAKDEKSAAAVATVDPAGKGGGKGAAAPAPELRFKQGGPAEPQRPFGNAAPAAAAEPKRESLERSRGLAEAKKREADAGPELKSAELRKADKSVADMPKQAPQEELAKSVRQLETAQKADDNEADLKALKDATPAKRAETAAKAAPGNALPSAPKAAATTGSPAPAPKPAAIAESAGTPAPKVATTPVAPTAAPPAPPQAVAVVEKEQARKDLDSVARNQNALQKEEKAEGGAGAPVADAAPKDEVRRRSAAPTAEIQKKTFAKKEEPAEQIVFYTANPDQLMKDIQAVANASGARIEFANGYAGEADKAADGRTLGTANRFRAGQATDVALVMAAADRETLLAKLRNLNAQQNGQDRMIGGQAGGGAGAVAQADANADAKQKTAANKPVAAQAPGAKQPQTPAPVPAEETADAPTTKSAASEKKVAEARGQELNAFAGAAPQERIVIRIHTLPRNPNADMDVKAKQTDK